VHSEKDYEAAIEASGILFGSGTAESLMKLSESDLLSVFEGVPKMNLIRSELQNGINIIDLLADKTNIFPSRGEARKMLQGGGVFLNKEKITEPDMNINSSQLIKDKYLLAQKGKKNYFLIIVQ
jgi:tyrosyl-tRNA synthetase